VLSLKELNSKQLVELVNAAEKRKVELQSETLVRARERIQKLLNDEGLTLEAVFGRRYATGRKGAKASAVAKFQNPKDSSQTWAGRGKRPLWLSAALKRGAKLEDFAIGSRAVGSAKTGPAAKSAAKKTKAAAKGKARTVKKVAAKKGKKA
jgi:DNA-binding protein H-NS